MIKLFVLAENTASQSCFQAEHGLSLYLKTDRQTILFDAGQTDLFAENAARLNLDLQTVDRMILSRYHYDHSGGVERFLQENDHAPVYLTQNAFGSYYNAEGKFIGVARELEQNSRIQVTGDYTRLDEELELCTCNDFECAFPIDSAGLTCKHNSTLEPDRFLHEQYLIVRDGDRKIVFSGCSHKGVLNIMEWLKPDIFVGGFHFMKQPIIDGKNEVLDSAANRLLNYPTTYYTCHCTGTEQYQYLKEKMGDRLYYLSTGQEIIL